jgi:hypothetical protein
MLDLPMKALTPRAPRRYLAVAILAAACSFSGAASAHAAGSIKKSIWGPPVTSAKDFATYHDLGVGIYQTAVSWRQLAPTQPAHPTDSSDPAYHWPAYLTDAVARAKAHGIKVSVVVQYTPGWANGGQAENVAPTNASDYADFMKAISRRYRYVHYWQIWSEASRRARFSPMAQVHNGRPLTNAEKRGPRRYARILNAAYGAVKSIDRSDLVIGGNTNTRGDVRPLRFIQAMRLPNGKPPRMDLYGHNPYSPRKPDLSKKPFSTGAADFCDLDTLAYWIDKYLGRTPRGRKIRIFIGEYTLASNRNYEFSWWGNKQDQARYVRAALHVTRTFNRVYTMGWYQLFDQPPNGAGDQVNFGLLDYKGNKKPSYYAYKNH